MGLGTRKIKIEMKGTGGGRWMTRESAKKISSKARRAADTRNVREWVRSPRLRADDAVLISNPRDVPDRYVVAISDAAELAVRAGAVRPLEYIGIGMTGVVFCDAKHAFKVARTERAKEMLEEESEWLATASDILEVRPRVAAFVAWDRELGVITRECVQGRPGTWSAGSRVSEIFDQVAPFMLAAGWTMPELKEDSVIFDEAGRGKIVDASMPSRVSDRLLAYVESVLDGQRSPRDYETVSDFAFYIRREFGQKPPMDEARAKRLLERLYALGARE
jgi:hypothetical protein